MCLLTRRLPTTFSPARFRPRIPILTWSDSRPTTRRASTAPFTIIRSRSTLLPRSVRCSARRPARAACWRSTRAPAVVRQYHAGQACRRHYRPSRSSLVSISLLPPARSLPSWLSLLRTAARTSSPCLPAGRACASSSRAPPGPLAALADRIDLNRRPHRATSAIGLCCSSSGTVAERGQQRPPQRPNRQNRAASLLARRPRSTITAPGRCRPFTSMTSIPSSGSKATKRRSWRSSPAFA